MSGMDRVKYNIRTPLILSFSQQEGQEDSQKNKIDNKISELIQECGICYEPKNLGEMQKIPHNKYTGYVADGITKCPAYVRRLYCKKCIIKLTIPKTCPLCRDRFAIPLETPYLDADLHPSVENQQINIPIPYIAQNPDEDELAVQWYTAPYVECGLASCKFICVLGCLAVFAFTLHIVIPYFDPSVKK